MGLFSNRDKKTQNAVQVNNVNSLPNIIVGWDGLGWKPNKKGYKNFADAYQWICLSTIIRGLSNVTYSSTSNSITPRGIASFLNTNYTLLFNQYVTMGYIAVRHDKDYNYELLNANDIKKDAMGRVINRDTVVVYSPEYSIRRRTPVFMSIPILEMLNVLGNTMSESSTNMGVLPIISGASIPANPRFKEDLANAMTKNYGWGEDQMRYFLSQAELKVDEINLHISDLQLRDNILGKFKELLNYWNIPVPLVIDDSASYNNISEARREFYGSCVRFYAENILQIGQALLTASPEFLPKNTLNYHFNNIPEMEKTLSGFCEEKTAYLELLKKFAESGVDTSDEMQRMYDEIKLTIKSV